MNVLCLIGRLSEMERLEGLYEEEKWTPFSETNTESGEASAALKEPALGNKYATSESECTPTTGPDRTQKPHTKAKQAKASEKPSEVAQVPAKKMENSLFFFVIRVHHLNSRSVALE